MITSINTQIAPFHRGDRNISREWPLRSHRVALHLTCIQTGWQILVQVTAHLPIVVPVHYHHHAIQLISIDHLRKEFTHQCRSLHLGSQQPLAIFRRHQEIAMSMATSLRQRSGRTHLQHLPHHMNTAMATPVLHRAAQRIEAPRLLIFHLKFPQRHQSQCQLTIARAVRLF